MNGAERRQSVADVVSNGGAAVVDADTGKRRRPLQPGARAEVARSADRAFQMPHHQPDRLVAIQVVGGIGVAIGRGFDGVNECIDAGRRGEVRRQAGRQDRVEQDDIGLELIAPQPHLRAIGI